MMSAFVMIQIGNAPDMKGIHAALHAIPGVKSVYFFGRPDGRNRVCRRRRPGGNDGRDWQDPRRQGRRQHRYAHRRPRVNNADSACYRDRSNEQVGGRLFPPTFVNAKMPLTREQD